MSLNSKLLLDEKPGLESRCISSICSDMALFPKNNGGESDETSRIFCGHVNFPEMNLGISVYGGYGGTKSNNHKEGG